MGLGTAFHNKISRSAGQEINGIDHGRMDLSAKARWRLLRNAYRAGILLKEIKTVRNKVSDIMITINCYLQSNAPNQESAIKSCNICRVPKNLREVHEQGFDPKLVSIGPLHRHESRLKPMEEHKKRFLLRLLNSMNQNGTTIEAKSSTTQDKNRNGRIFHPMLVEQRSAPITNAKFEDLVLLMNNLEAKAKECYTETFANFGPNEFVMMMILDGCFVVELLRFYSKCESGDKETDDPIFHTRWMLPNLQRDFLLLENQLPFFVLNEIFKITSSEKDKFSLTELTLKFFDPLLSRDQNLLQKCRVETKPDHLLGFFRSTFLSSFILDMTASSVQHHHADNNQMNIGINIGGERQLIHCATELREGGIAFRKRENHDLLDIEFTNGKLYIPPLLIDDHTAPVFLNFVAYEQCNRYSAPYFTHYLLFFDSLVNSSKDVEHLHHKGIIDHVLGSDEDVANLFNKLCKEVVHDVDDCYLSKPLKDVNRYFHMKRHKWWAKWKHDYFSNPWTFTSFLAAIFLLLLTTIQTFFSVFGYFLPPS